MEIKSIMKQQRNYFNAQNTKSYEFRMKQLSILKNWIIKNESILMKALKDDLNKSSTESYMSEIGMILSEITYTQKHLKGWMRKHYVATPLAQFCATSYEQYEPFGIVLIMSPWNYPFMLSMSPLIGAIAAGNCAVIKPSAYAHATSIVIANMMEQCFKDDYITCVLGGREANKELLDERFDYIFFTGGVSVGRLVMEKASVYLTPITLELGGKSPCIVDKKANIKLAAKRIAFGKYLNAGQTCVAPDYVFVHESIKDELIHYLKEYIQMFFKDDILNNHEYPKIINQKHFDRLIHLLDNKKIVIGGSYDPEKLIITPTVLNDVRLSDDIMQEEIFGPIMPLIPYQNIKEVITYINSKEKPLALYLFTNDKACETIVLNQCSFGGGCVNDTIIHLASNKLGFGGVGQSGIGSYHGKRSFTTFSHQYSIVKKATWIDLPFRYQPYTKLKDKMIRYFLK
ncbi:MAG: aldehyde dehydrogenase [Erysipelotrichaceae bacterium]